MAGNFMLKTLADDPEWIQAGNDKHTRVKCACGRVKPAEMMVDLRPIGGRNAGRNGASKAMEFCCDACRGRYRRSGQIRDEDMFREHGAPAERIAHAKAQDDRRRLRREGIGKPPFPPGWGHPQGPPITPSAMPLPKPHRKEEEPGETA